MTPADEVRSGYKSIALDSPENRDAWIERDRNKLPDVDQLIAELIHAAGDGLARHRLQALGERARPAALRALGRHELWRGATGESQWGAAFGLVVHLIGRPIPRKAVTDPLRHAGAHGGQVEQCEVDHATRDVVFHARRGVQHPLGDGIPLALRGRQGFVPTGIRLTLR